MKLTKTFAFLGLLAFLVPTCTIWQSRAVAENAAFPPARISEYLMPQKTEIALARSAAPPSISADATVMVLTPNGYTTTVQGRNGFLCLVERSWGTPTTDAEFWNTRIRGPICFNPAAARTFAPIYLLKTKLVLTEKSRKEIARTLASSFDKEELPALAPGAMCYMLSRQQYLSGADGNWHPHLMFYVSGDAGKDWGGNSRGSPVLATNDPEERATIFMVLVDRWSDGTRASKASSR
jgi:hypothetical protein